MNLHKIKAALAAAKEIKTAEDRNKALAVYQAVLSQNSSKTSSNISDNNVTVNHDHLLFFPDDILETIVGKMEKTAELYHSALSVSQTHACLLQARDNLLGGLQLWLRQIRSLNGGCLPMHELYELEAEANSIAN